MRALDPEVGDAVWEAVKALIPPPPRTHPLGCHRPRVSDRLCFEVIRVRLATGCSWEDAERLCGDKVSDTTVRTRRDEWIAVGVFDRLVDEAIAAYDRIIELNLSDVAVYGSQHKSPGGGPGTGPNPTDRGKLGHKWSILTVTASRSAGPSMEPTATTPHCSPPPSTPPLNAVCSSISRRCGSTAATTPKRPATGSPGIP